MEFRVSGPYDLLNHFEKARIVESGWVPFDVEDITLASCSNSHETAIAEVEFPRDMSAADARDKLEAVLGNVASTHDMEEELERVSVDRIEVD